MSKYMHTSILMERIVINCNTYIFKPIGILRGNYEEKHGTFIDEYNNMYYSMTDASTVGLDAEETHCFSGYYTDSQLKQAFPAETKKESIQHMFEQFLDNIWIGYISGYKPEEINILAFSLENLENLYGEKSNYLLNLDYDDDTALEFNMVISEEKIKELLNITDLCKLKEELKIVYDKYVENKNIIIKTNNKVVDNEKPNIKEDKKSQIINSNNIYDSEKLHKKIDVIEMYKYITDRVIGQDDAIRQIITTFLMNKVNNSINIEEELTRVLLTGPTGCGKTLIIETMLEYLSSKHQKNFPIAKIPTSQLTIAGYVGMNLEDILSTLVSNTKGCFLSEEEKINYAEHNGIVFLDEIDKKGSNSNGDVSGRGVLNSLLEFLTGSDYEIGHKKQKFNTKNLTIFAAGAFNNVYNKSVKQGIGFNSNTINQKQNLSMENFVNEGLMPNELMGRFHKIVNLNPISQNVLSEILIKSKKSSLISIQEKLSKLGVELYYDQTFIDKVAEEAHKRKLGARSLKSIIEESLFEIQWTALQNKAPGKITVTSDTVVNPKNFILKPR